MRSIKGDHFSTFCKMITFYHTWVMETCFPNPQFVSHISCLAYLSLFLRKPKLTVGRAANLIRLARHVWMNKISYRTSIHLFPSDFLNKSEFLGLVWECSFDAERIFLWSTFSWKQSFSGADWRPVISNWATRRLWTRVIPLGAIFDSGLDCTQLNLLLGTIFWQ